jgi:hypothetical protein
MRTLTRTNACICGKITFTVQRLNTWRLMLCPSYTYPALLHALCASVQPVSHPDVHETPLLHATSRGPAHIAEVRVGFDVPLYLYHAAWCCVSSSVRLSPSRCTYLHVVHHTSFLFAQIARCICLSICLRPLVCLGHAHTCHHCLTNTLCGFRHRHTNNCVLHCVDLHRTRAATGRAALKFNRLRVRRTLPSPPPPCTSCYWPPLVRARCYQQDCHRSWRLSTMHAWA